MKTPSESLYHLIHSLGQNEKRYFILQSAKDNNSYLDLFRVINSQNTYNEALVRNKLNSNEPGKFKKLKNYAFNSILKSLESYYSNNSDEILVLRKFIQAEILLDKKLFADSRKIIKSALKLSIDKDLLFFIPPCYERLYKIGVAAGNPQQSILEINPVLVSKSVRDCGRWLEIKHLNTLFWNYIHTSTETATKEEKKLLETIIKQAGGILKREPAGFTIKRESYLLLGLASRFSGKGELSYRYRKLLVELIESEPKYLYDRKHDYMVALGNLMNMCRDLGKTEETIRAYEKASRFIGEIPKRLVDFRLDEIFCNVMNSYVTFLFAQKKYAEVIRNGEALLKRIKAHKDKFENSLLSILYQNLMYSFFFCNDFKSSMRYHHLQMKRHSKNDVSRLLFGLVILFESGDLDALHYKCRSVQYYIQKSKAYPAESLLVKAFSGELQKQHRKEEMKILFKKLLSEMQSCKREFDSLYKEYKFDYMDWVRMKAEDKAH